MLMEKNGLLADPIVKDQTRMGASTNLPSGNTPVSSGSMITGEGELFAPYTLDT